MRRHRWFLGAIAVLAAIGCAKDNNPIIVHKPSSDSKAAPVRSTLGKWTLYSAPNGSFRAEYPWGNTVIYPFTGFDPPVHAPLSEGKHYRTSFLSEDGKLSYMSDFFDIVEVKFQAKTVGPDREKALDELLQKTAELRKIKLSNPKPVTWGDQLANEYTATETLELPSGNKEAHAVFRVLPTEKFGFIASIRDMGKITPGDEKKFFDSFVLLPETGSKESSRRA